MVSSVGDKFGFPVCRVPTYTDEIVLPFTKVGIEVEVENARPLNVSQWLWKTDHSLRNSGMEYVTNGGLQGMSIVKAVKDLCTTMKDSGFSDGYPRAGIHVHVDVTDMNESDSSQLLRMIGAYALFEKAMFKFAGEWRESCGFCDPLFLSQKDFLSIRNMLTRWDSIKSDYVTEYRFSKYQALNFLPLTQFGTVEWRQLPTTLDADRIIAWVNLCLCFKRFAMEQDVTAIQILCTNGVRATAEAVFGNKLYLIEEFIDDKEVYDALATALALTYPFKEVQHRWQVPNSTLIERKKIKIKPEKPSENLRSTI